MIQLTRDVINHHAVTEAVRREWGPLVQAVLERLAALPRARRF